MDARTERIGAGYVLGADPEPIMSLFARIGGPLTARLLQLLLDVLWRYSCQVHLLILVDCCPGHPEEMGTH